MREIPGYYFDPERNRYFRIERGNSRANLSNSAQTNATEPTRPAHYDIDTIRKIKKTKAEKGIKRTEEQARILAYQIHLNEPQVNERIAKKFSPLSILLSSRSHRPPNQITSSYTERFIRPYLPRLLKKRGSFTYSNEATTAVDVKLHCISF